MEPIKFKIEYGFPFKDSKYIYMGAIICLLQQKKKINKKNIIKEIKNCVDITGFLENMDESGIFDIYGIEGEWVKIHYDTAEDIFNKLINL